jgi:hypothetical protein
MLKCWSINDVMFLYVSCKIVYRWAMTNCCVKSDKHRLNPAPCNFYTDGQEGIIWNSIREMATDI